MESGNKSTDRVTLEINTRTSEAESPKIRYPKPKSEFIRVERIDSQMRKAARAAQTMTTGSKDIDFKLVLAQPSGAENNPNGAHYVLKSFVNPESEKNKERKKWGKT